MNTCGTQLSKAKAEVGCEALSSSLDAWIGNNMLQEDTSSALQAEASPCEKKSCDSIARGVQQTSLGTLSATKHGLYSSHVAQQAKIRQRVHNAASERKARSKGPRPRGPSGALNFTRLREKDANGHEFQAADCPQNSLCQFWGAFTEETIDSRTNYSLTILELQ